MTPPFAGVGTRQELSEYLVQPPASLQRADLGAVVGDEGPRSLLCVEHALDLHLSVGPHDGVEVDGEVGGELPHRRQLVAGPQRTPDDAVLDPIDDLAVEGHTAVRIDGIVQGGRP
jgi:hypothetical protein